MEHINPGHWTRELLANSGMNEWWISSLTVLIDFAVLIAASLIADWITRRIVVAVIHRAVKRSKATWDDHFFKEKVFQAMVHLMPTLIVRGFLPVVFEDVPRFIGPLDKALGIMLIYQIVLLINRAARAGSHVVEELEAFKDKPVRTLLSVVLFLSWLVGALAVVSALTNTSLASILGALAGATAIFILIFQDAINGLLANFQIVLYDLIKKGDWVTFDKFGVDGDVVSIDLTTVKIKNFDNTISSVPAKAFVTDSFINWRGMRLAQVRRIKRNLVVDLESVGFADDALIASLERVERLRPYLAARGREIAEHNAQFGVDKSHPVNGRHMTNLGLFRAYAFAYLEEHPRISKGHTLMVRQLQTTPNGVPLEIYAFATTIVWTEYEVLTSDLMDHLIAAAPSFGLRLFQSPTAQSVRGTGLALS